MYDKIKILMGGGVPSIALKATGPFMCRGIMLLPTYNKSIGCIQYFDGKIRNLLIRMDVLRNQFWLTNSIHKFYLHYNYDDFYLSDAKDAFRELSDILGIDVFTGTIKQIEYGCNIPVENKKLLLNSLVSYKCKDYAPMLDKGKRYGSKCTFIQHALKLYDKSFQVKKQDGITIDPALCRWEAAVNYMQHLHKRGIAIHTVADLVDYEKAQYLVNDLIQKFLNTKKVATLNTAGLTLRENTAVARMSHPVIKAAVKANQPATYRNDIRICNKILDGSESPYMDAVVGLIADKCTELLNA